MVSSASILSLMLDVTLRYPDLNSPPLDAVTLSTHTVSLSSHQLSSTITLFLEGSGGQDFNPFIYSVSFWLPLPRLRDDFFISSRLSPAPPTPSLFSQICYLLC